MRVPMQQRPDSLPTFASNSVYLASILLFMLLIVRGISAAADDAGSGNANQPPPATAVSIQRGQYLTTILGCGGCHTEGALQGLPYGPHLAGSKTGIAYTDPESSDFPGIVFPANLSTHKTQGLGEWSRQDIARAIRNGINHRGGEVISVMPWINYSLLSKQDTYDIVDYLQSLPAVEYSIPDNVVLGEPSRRSYLRIGIYRFDPDPE